jgi:uncharacterized membrane protein
MPINIFTTFDDPSAVSGTQASGVNGTDQIVGIYQGSTGTHGFLLSGGTFTSLDKPSAQATAAFGINSSGQIVGEYVQPSLGACSRSRRCSPHGCCPRTVRRIRSFASTGMLKDSKASELET